MEQGTRLDFLQILEAYIMFQFLCRAHDPFIFVFFLQMMYDPEDRNSDRSCGCCDHREVIFLPKPRILRLIKCWFLYLKSRRWGLQMLIRLTLREKVILRHFIVFCIGLILSLSWAEQYISDVKAFIEFRTNILKNINFTNFDNVNGADRYLIPNYIHYIRLEQPEIRQEGNAVFDLEL